LSIGFTGALVPGTLTGGIEKTFSPLWGKLIFGTAAGGARFPQHLPNSKTARKTPPLPEAIGGAVMAPR
jgi:hypothetical protein